MNSPQRALPELLFMNASCEFKRSEVSDVYLGLFQEAEEAELLWSEDQECVASAVDASGRPAHPVDVLL